MSDAISGPTRPRLLRPDVARAAHPLERALVADARDPAALEEAVRGLPRVTQSRDLDLLPSLARNGAPEGAPPERPSSISRHR